MNTSTLLIYIAVMAGVTYLIRMLPLALIRKKIQNPFIRSFLYYIPYAVLAAMTIPAIFYSTESVLSAAVGFVAALVLSFFGKPLLTVAAVSCLSVYIVEIILKIF